MAIQVKNKFIEEEITDEEGKVVGILKFNPSDTRIMSRLGKCMDYAEKSLKKVKAMGEMPDLSKMKIETVEDAEKISDSVEKLATALNIEEECSTFVIDELSEIFGKDVIELFTGGTNDIEAIQPILDFVMPHVKKARGEKVSKYLTKKNSDVME